MTKTVATNVILVSVNHIDDEEAEQMAADAGYDDVAEYAESLESTVEALMALQFDDADDIPILDVSTEVYEEWDEDEANELAQ